MYMYIYIFTHTHIKFVTLCANNTNTLPPRVKVDRAGCQGSWVPRWQLVGHGCLDCRQTTTTRRNVHSNAEERPLKGQKSPEGKPQGS